MTSVCMNNPFNVKEVGGSSCKGVVCIFCYRFGRLTFVDSVQIKNFFRFLGRFVGHEITTHVGVGGSSDLLECNDFLRCCEDCKITIGSFCELYHELKCLELKLEWKLRSLVKIMRLANRVPSRMEELKRRILEEMELEDDYKQNENRCGKLERLKDFRSSVIRQCNRRLKVSQPKVFLERRIVKEDVEPKLHSFMSISGHSDSNQRPTQPSDIAEARQHFLGWILSLSAISMLATSSVPVNRNYSTATEVPCYDRSDLESLSSVKMIFDIDETFDNNSAAFLEDVNEDTYAETYLTLSPLGIGHGNQEESNDVEMVNNAELSQLKRDNCAEISNKLGNREICIGSEDISQEVTAEMLASNNPDDISFQSGNIVPALLDVLPQLQELSVETKPTVESETQQSQQLPLISNLKVVSTKSFQCSDCTKCFQKNSRLKAHITRIHSANLTKEYRCGVCRKLFSSYKDLRYHKIFSIGHQTLKNIFLSKQQHVKLETGSAVQIPKDRVMETEKSMDATDEMKTGDEIHSQIGDENSEPPQSQRYNLRKKKKHSYREIDGETQSDPNDDEPMHTSESVMSSSSSSDSDDVDNCYNGTKERVKPIGNVKIEKKTYQNTANNQKRLYCFLEGCTKRWNADDREKYDKHKKFHAPGHYKCMFCDKTERTVVRLSIHEHKNHATRRGSYSVGNRKVFYCPRCPFETIMPQIFKNHFASSHIPGFESLVERNKSLEQCNICKLNIVKERVEAHFKSVHDSTNVSPKKIKKCTVEGCPAYFACPRGKNILMNRHLRQVHKFNASKEENESEDDIDVPREEEGGKVNTRLKCKLCRKSFSDYNYLQTHKRIFHKSNITDVANAVTTEDTKFKFICPDVRCTKRFSTFDDLEGHFKLHGSFKCQFCDVVKEYATELALHEVQQHGSVKRMGRVRHSYSCSRCPDITQTQHNFTKHFLSTHLNLSRIGVTCPICKVENKGGESSGFLYHHFRLQHNVEGLDPSKIHRCDLCPAYFNRGKLLGTHKIEFHWKNKCPKCAKQFSKKNRMLKEHLEKRHPEFDAFPTFTFSCDIGTCKRRFPSEMELNRHKRVFTHDSPVLCPKCGKKFLGKERLAAHMYNIHSDRSHACCECGKTFNTKEKLNIHMEYHKGPDSWKFQCSTCGKKCTNRSKLNQHLRTHTKEKPYVCQYCGAKYAHQHNWRNHVNTKHKGEKGEEEVDTAAKNVSKDFRRLSRKGTKRGDCILASATNK